MIRFAPDTKDSFWNTMMEPFSAFDNTVMKTDVREKDGKYLLDINLAGYGKEDIKISLYNGTLTVAADHNETKEEKDARGNLLRRERYTGSCKRSWYIGEGITEHDIQARYENGVLSLEVPMEGKKEEPQQKQIAIM